MTTGCEHRRGVGFCSLCRAGWSPEAAARIAEAASRARLAEEASLRDARWRQSTTPDAVLNAKLDELCRDLGLCA